jgi:LexA-binding, inner membrane-associated putative hydrolase
MVIGHFGFGLGAKKFAPKISLGTLFIAVQFADLLWPVLLLLNVEHVSLQRGNTKFPLDFSDYPITHSLAMAILWGACFGLIYWAVKKDIRSAVVLGICVLSHWVLDLVVHIPDLPLYPGESSPKVGLGVWNWPWITALVEGTLFIIGLILYLRTTHAKNKSGVWGLWLLVILLVVAHVAGIFSPLPPSAHAIGWAAQYQWIFILLAYWVDRNRVTGDTRP